MSVKLELAVGQSIRIGEGTVITLEHKSGHRARLCINAPLTDSVVLMKPANNEQKQQEKCFP